MTRSFAPLPIAVHLGSEVVRMMQVTGGKNLHLKNAVEIPSSDYEGLTEALRSFKGKQCSVCIAAEDVLIQHIRVPLEADDFVIRSTLLQHDPRWSDAEIRQLCVTTTGRSGNPKQELLCVGVERSIAMETVEKLESAGAEVIAITVPLYAAVRAFYQLYRRDGDEKMVSMLIDMENNAHMVMISHGSNCVFAHQLEMPTPVKQEKWEPPQSLKPITPQPSEKVERQEGGNPRGLYGIEEESESLDAKMNSELLRCLRHHDTVFPDSAVERIIFTGSGANDTERCAAIASALNISGFVADPSAWISGAVDLAGGPAWTTVAGLCMRQAELAA